MITPIILAAGKSSRMGERHKLLMDIYGRSIIEIVVDNVLSSKLADPILIYSDSRVRNVVEKFEVPTIFNPDTEKGMSSSMVLGLSHIKDETDGVIFVFGDMPFVNSEILNTLSDEFEKLPDKDERIVCPYYMGERRLPNIYGRYFFQMIRGLQGDIGPRYILKAHMEQVVKVDFTDEFPFLDIDNIDDYQNVLKILRETN